ncbi:Cytochrome c heme lyase subunit CcmF [hydrothermal vent metagenome]|uniref:Cytochrome c heme lyase subunit CcmF n=1 Tax=hydrothermal vent metagenome TaxID=652676 RepID=A0A3B1AM58_9ZZZZ
MIPEIGNFALILALCLAIAQGIFPLIGSLNNTPSWVALARPLAWGQALFLTIATGLLTYAFLISDFSVLYVATNSNTLLPNIYKVSAVWGAHEGSLLLWSCFMGLWGAAIAIFSKNLAKEVVGRVLAVMGLINIGFLLFMLFTSNPFDRIFPVPLEGRDLNPLLQDIGLALHPPTLYLGYVGFSVAFGFAIAALIGGRLDASWAKWSRPWTTAAWVWLTFGIGIGSWWAYYELGWGGWWFWDPVENASFMPWLAGTALMHSLAVTEKRGAFRSWTVMLALLAFSLSLLGTFLVRSGVLTSVHAFAADPDRGMFILVFLIIVIGGALVLYAWRAPTIFGGGRFDLISRESFLLGNNLLLTVLTFLILFGTLAPLIYDAMNWGKISVGFPWFNKMFLMLTPFLAILIGFGPLMRWKKTDGTKLMKQLRIAAIFSILVGLVAFLPAISNGSPLVPLGLFLAAWIISSHITGIYERLRHKNGIGSFFSDLAGKGRSYYGMVLAHFGVALFIIGTTIVSNHSVERDLRMSLGESAEIGGYRFVFKGVTRSPGPNYTANRGEFQIFKDDVEVAVLEPEKRTYMAQTMPMTEAAIDWGLTRDLYVSLGENLGGGDWSVRLYYKPFMCWIWLGGLAMAFGGILAASDRRYRDTKQGKKQGSSSTTTDAPATESS